MSSPETKTLGRDTKAPLGAFFVQLELSIEGPVGDKPLSPDAVFDAQGTQVEMNGDPNRKLWQRIFKEGSTQYGNALSKAEDLREYFRWLRDSGYGRSKVIPEEMKADHAGYIADYTSTIVRAAHKAANEIVVELNPGPVRISGRLYWIDLDPHAGPNRLYLSDDQANHYLFADPSSLIGDDSFTMAGYDICATLLEDLSAYENTY